MKVPVELRTDEGTVLAKGIADVIGTKDGVYATQNTVCDVELAGVATHAIITLGPLVKVRSNLDGPVDIQGVGFTATLEWKGSKIVAFSGTNLDPLEDEES